MDLVEPIKIRGLTEFRTALRRISSDLPKGMRVAANAAAEIVVKRAQPKIPARSGAARRSVRAASTQAQGRVKGGGARVPYYPWLDFGGRVGRKRSVHRAFLPGGRYIYVSYDETKEQVYQRLIEELVKVSEAAGVAVDGQ